MLVGCLTSHQHASVSQGRICTDNCTCCHTEIEVADQTFYLTQSQYTDTGPTGPSACPIMPGAWQGSHWSANVEVTGMTTRPMRRWTLRGDTVEETKAAMKVIRTSGKYVLMYSKMEKAVVCSLPRTQVANFISKGTIFCGYVPETA